MQRFKTAHLALYLTPTVGEEKSEAVVRSALRALSITGDEILENDAMAVLDFIGRSRDMVGLAARLARRNIELGRPPETPARTGYGSSAPPTSSAPASTPSAPASSLSPASPSLLSNLAPASAATPNVVSFGIAPASAASGVSPSAAAPSSAPPSVAPAGLAPPSVALTGLAPPSVAQPPLASSQPASVGAPSSPGAVLSGTAPVVASTTPPDLTLTTLADMLSPSLGEENGRRLTTEAAQLRGIQGPTLTHAEALEVLEILASQRGLVGCVARFAKARLLLG